ncbi:hypothetical protein B0T20DRAFT_347656 [Sordaria brevicollis]|uniref:Uncharacterized protein n=1 Tax=Sordaria brevicollis TaxID=83679 RepID=A0AAE0PJS5_SORBR|nr:hypothetical protein B0T20DRAFT_347656 [Sordaria brevicollis]
MAHHHRHLNDLLHFRGHGQKNLHYQRHPPAPTSQPPPPPEKDLTTTPTDAPTPTRRRRRQILARVDTSSSILTTITIPSTTTPTTETTSAPTFIATPSTLTNTNPLSTAPRINAQSTTASRNEIILLALGIFILVGQLALIIYVGVRRRRFSLSQSSAVSGSTTCAYHHSRWHRDNCPRELNGLQLDGRAGGGGRGRSMGCSCGLPVGGKGKGKGRAIHTHGHGHGHGKGGERNCLWKEAFGESPTSPMSSRTFGLRAGEGLAEVERGVEVGEEVEMEGEGSRSGIRSRGNSVVIAGAYELVERVRKRSNSLGTFLMGIGTEVVPDINEPVTRKRSHTFSMGLGRRRNSKSGGEVGLRERRRSAAATEDVEMGVGRTSGLNTDFGGKFDGVEEHEGDGRERSCPGFGHQHGVQDLEKGVCRSCDSLRARK